MFQSAIIILACASLTFQSVVLPISIKADLAQKRDLGKLQLSPRQTTTTQTTFTQQLEVYQSCSTSLVQAQSTIVDQRATYEETYTYLKQVRTSYETKSSSLSTNCACKADTNEMAVYQQTVIQATTAFQETARYCLKSYTNEQFATLQVEFRGIWVEIERSAEFAATASIDVKAIFKSAQLDTQLFVTHLKISLKGVLAGVLGAVGGALSAAGNFLSNLL
ncbi:hypothetical protein CROQUDRAFT_105278 [Cronartium quercuum f. sp. fusiforme G11]|uniref:Uncharacterized protein n=1 Tax=Cronartium quercuum f. sp. fusiforme G11 TaxID=708437 RepID=A0A9P6NNA8_9BASI|nr:hypothetical protein CROQUDRAFT_105278 [Cronartium quercuum f. sp. fusiforme G11]